MTLGDYNDYRGWPIPDDEDESTCGYLVEYLDGGDPNHPKHSGYISWSPKTVFEKAYRECSDDLDFGDAIMHLKRGAKVARAGWNGKGMFLELQRPDIGSKMTFPYPFFTIPDCEEGTRKIPYAPTIVDIMSADWGIVA